MKQKLMQLFASRQFQIGWCGTFLSLCVVLGLIGTNPVVAAIDWALADVQDGRGEEAGEGLAQGAVARVRDGDAVLAETLEEATHLALHRAVEILNISLDDPDKEIRNATGRMILNAVQIITTMKLRADEGSFRRQMADRMPDILERIKHHEKFVPPLIEG